MDTACSNDIIGEMVVYRQKAVKMNGDTLPGG